MKKKIILALTACLFAAGSIINMHLAQSDHNTDISLADISVMAQADGESGGGWVKCRQTGTGIPFFFRNCLPCKTVFMSYSSDTSMCYR